MVTRREMEGDLYATEGNELKLLLKDGTEKWFDVEEVQAKGIITNQSELCTACGFRHPKKVFIPFSDIVEVTNIMSK